MTTEHELNVHNKELEYPGSLYVGPEMLTALEQTSRGEPLTWGATPLQPYRPDIAIQQREVRRQISDFFPKQPKKVPYGLSWDTARYIEDNFIMRNQRRLSRNYDSYQYRGNTNISKIPLWALGFVDRSLSGHASPAEIIATAEIEQIPTAELGSISIPYGMRIEENLEPMREAVKEGVLFHGGTLVEPQPVLEVRHANFLTTEYEATEPTLLMTRIVKIGEIGEDIKVMERSSFGVVLPRLAPELIEEITDIRYSETWSKKILKIKGFEEAVFNALENNEYGVVVPVSTTAVQVNERLVKNLLENNQHKEARQLLIAHQALASSGKASLI